jgi:hypothetical protein
MGEGSPEVRRMDLPKEYGEGKMLQAEKEPTESTPVARNTSPGIDIGGEEGPVLD